VLAFADVGQVQDVGQNFAWQKPIYRTSLSPAIVPFFTDPYATTYSLTGLLTRPAGPQVTQVGTANAFNASIGGEVRFFMPVLNVPFRLIMADNPWRAGVLDKNGQQTHQYVFKFAVGTTF
jgi:hypothetical protein